ncbi:MAG: winged helix-turn-helix transcriptional regulator [Bacteroidetes bacterium]|nr:winged helix-turn-helix transcriptional regulator [Bacteroidota bacterium]
MPIIEIEDAPSVATDPTLEFTALARYMKALSHPVRLHILALLGRESCCYSGDLAEELTIARSTLSQHLKELKEAGLIQGEINPPKIKYCLNRERWNELQFLVRNFLDGEQRR